MIQNRRFALAFRLGALLFALAGLMKQIGIFSGTVSFRAFMYYTIQSNVLAIALFAILSIRTVKSLREGTHGSAGWHTRFGMVCAADILVTLIVFWALLAPTVDAAYLWTFENIAVHTVTPLLCLLDYILFSEAGRLQYRDVYYVCIFPLGYVAFTTVAGLAGYVYGFEGILSSAFSSTIELVPIRFPYFFLDFDRLGAMALAYIGGILAFFLLLSHGIYWIDRKRRKGTA
ncbi:MAG: Pr6Pr family membrane protein [Oscillospiraceae bacterium]|nr:Pr6Pr family membrane protein [Oscillospiraceae bacterium]